MGAWDDMPKLEKIKTGVFQMDNTGLAYSMACKIKNLLEEAQDSGNQMKVADASKVSKLLMEALAIIQYGERRGVK